MKYCVLIISLVLFSCQSSNEQANSEGELTQETSDTEINNSEERDSPRTSSSEPSFKPDQLSGQWFSNGNEGVVDHWLEFDNTSKNFYSWLDDELLKSIPAGTFELENETLTLNHIEFNEAEKYRINSLTGDQLNLTPMGISAGDLVYSKRTYEPKFNYNILNREYYQISDTFNIYQFLKYPSFKFKFKDDKLTSWECDPNQRLEDCIERELRFLKTGLPDAIFKNLSSRSMQSSSLW
ncbi:MAG: hypothetical protein AAFY41_09535, partial [Bacteroidota bacterium]